MRSGFISCLNLDIADKSIDIDVSGLVVSWL